MENFVSSLEDKSRAESNTTSSDQAVNESVAMLSNYFDLTQKSSAPPTRGGDEPLPSTFGGKQKGDDAIPSARSGSSKQKASKLLLIVIGSFVFIATGGVLLSSLIFSSDKSAVEPAHAPAFPQAIETKASSSRATSGAVKILQAPPVAPTERLEAEGEPWPETMETYKKLLSKQDASNASAPKQTANDHVLGQYEAWLKAKPQ
jgi:hypothetical protein